MCRKVSAALANIEARRDKFAHIDDRELDRRKEAVDRLDKVRARARARARAARLPRAAPPANRRAPRGTAACARRCSCT